MDCERRPPPDSARVRIGIDRRASDCRPRRGAGGEDCAGPVDLPQKVSSRKPTRVVGGPVLFRAPDSRRCRR